MQQDFAHFNRTFHLHTISHRYTGSAWITLQNGGGSWSLLVDANLTRREDTGRPNSSPQTATTPIVRLQRFCNHTVEIPGKYSDTKPIVETKLFFQSTVDQPCRQSPNPTVQPPIIVSRHTNHGLDHPSLILLYWGGKQEVPHSTVLHETLPFPTNPSCSVLLGVPFQSDPSAF